MRREPIFTECGSCGADFECPGCGRKHESIRVAALFVHPEGPYINQPGIDAWDETRDARKYRGPWPVIAHSPCERWGRYWSGGPSAKERKTLGDDDGCFAAAFEAVNQNGGVLEHPEASHAWEHFGIRRPNPHGGWTYDARWDAWVCQVEQGHYGHPARKKTWLFVKLKRFMVPPELKWGPSTGRRLDEGFHSKEERNRARAAGKKPIPRLSEKQNKLTPEPFRDLLVQLASLVTQQVTSDD